MYEIFSKLLQKYGVTAYKVSKATGVSQSTLSDWKKGRITPKSDSLKKIADYFGVTVDYILTGETDVEPPKTMLTPKDEHDIAKDMESIIKKLKDNENGPASFEGEPIPEDDIDLLAGQIELMLRHLKPINKEKYKPDKNKK